MLYRRILKEIEDNEEEKSIIKDTAAIRVSIYDVGVGNYSFPYSIMIIEDLEEEVQRAFEMEPDICNRSNN